jgi:hypothetical protein
MDKITPFTDDAENAKTVVKRVTNGHDGETVTRSFKLIGLAEALSTLPCAK